ncbi:MAG: hypothetical protein A2Y10_13380 [Planctomycetes bacterium GWF2_41_51]|nr:MAG: hypothetical protein A2Y10_13380 [Planctomycetes bacterium GWF2_41_51]HBG26274.1 hypothetical protein [Phycisphaerales bacterium]
MKRKAFTLVELLVVISIIALLLAVLMPALQKAREQGQLTVCKAHMHSIGIAVMAYANSNKDRVPPDKFKPRGQNGHNWVGNICKQQNGDYPVGFGLLDPAYSPKKGVADYLLCPSDMARKKIKDDKDSSGDFKLFDTSYYNFGGVYRGMTASGTFAGDPEYKAAEKRIGNLDRHKTSVARASDATLAMCEWRHGKIMANKYACYDLAGMQVTVDLPHEKAPTLYLDGHVSVIGFVEYYRRAIAAGVPTSYSNARGSLTWNFWNMPSYTNTAGKSFYLLDGL